MAVSQEQLSELEEALAELGKDGDEVSAVLHRFEGGQRADLAAVDGELEALTEGATIAPIGRDPSTTETRAPDASIAADVEWENDQTEVEIIDPSDDFELLVEDGDIEEVQASANDAPRVTVPTPLPGQKATDVDVEVDADDEEDEGFFKKLFGSRRSSNRP